VIVERVKGKRKGNATAEAPRRGEKEFNRQDAKSAKMNLNLIFSASVSALSAPRRLHFFHGQN
jgi:hypothetical protein